MCYIYKSQYIYSRSAIYNNVGYLIHFSSSVHIHGITDGSITFYATYGELPHYHWAFLSDELRWHLCIYDEMNHIRVTRVYMTQLYYASSFYLCVINCLFLERHVANYCVVCGLYKTYTVRLLLLHHFHKPVVVPSIATLNYIIYNI